jgi:putative sigma-54 modulation protein
MQVIVRGKHFRVPDHVEERAQRKLSKLDHYLPLLQDAAVEVDLAHEKAKEPDQRYIARVTVSAHGVHLYAEERAMQPEAAIDQAARALAAQARRHKTKLYGRNRNRANKRPPAAGPAPAAEDDEAALPAEVTRVRRVAVKPMTAEEALDQMKLLGQDLFVFHDADLERFALFCRNGSGDIELIVPELS